LSLSSFLLFEAVTTEKVAGITRSEWQTSDSGATTATGPIAGYFGFVFSCSCSGSGWGTTFALTMAISTHKTSGTPRFKREFTNGGATTATGPISLKHNGYFKLLGLGPSILLKLNHAQSESLLSI
jgi:hypothetical protein